MKKYQQLLIVSLGLVSFICFLIYKHEYDRLRNVLEVLEVFGSPPSPGSNQNVGALGSHPLEGNQNPSLSAGSINELNLGSYAGDGVNNKKARLAYDVNKKDQSNLPSFDDKYFLKNGHIRPPDNEEVGAIDNGRGRSNKGNVVLNQNQIQTQGSGEVVDNMPDDGANLGDLQSDKKPVQRQPQGSIFREMQRAEAKPQDNKV